ncbi:hypothetical protein llap_10500 [Limosa lapponica baueri]|uniref:Uncharacterized protein n=1 Tax=Limosa lapponica baueri TaxID=1758121 RepID=A0A2I0TZI7_LIMLA|nr:hypothetical protein llap_10500 [Limosa lapponica baueri]
MKPRAQAHRGVSLTSQRRLSSRDCAQGPSRGGICVQPCVIETEQALAANNHPKSYGSCTSIMFMGITFTGITFMGLTFMGATFMGIMFMGVTFMGITFIGATFMGIMFLSTMFMGPIFISITFMGIMFTGITFMGITFMGITFMGITFTGNRVCSHPLELQPSTSSFSLGESGHMDEAEPWPVARPG